jgi:hypothetical protein
MLTKIITFFDKLEDKIRSHLSRFPIVYAFIGGIGVILFWRGIWHTADIFEVLNGPVSTILGTIILLLSGVFVSAFIGNRIIITGLRGEKKLAEKTETEVVSEESELKNIQKTVNRIEKDLSDIKKDLPKN